jgi:hypothetical protein
VDLAAIGKVVAKVGPALALADEPWEGFSSALLHCNRAERHRRLLRRNRIHEGVHTPSSSGWRLIPEVGIGVTISIGSATTARRRSRDWC